MERLPEAVIVDIDGTIAQHPQRDHYAYWQVDGDTLNLPIIRLCEWIPYSVRVLIVTGRHTFRDANSKNGGGPDCDVRAMTEQWLARYNIRYDQLLMRPYGDFRSDDIIKEELYLEHILPHYNVLFVLDDRQRVVDMWRRHGLTCLQVGEGDF